MIMFYLYRYEKLIFGLLVLLFLTTCVNKISDFRMIVNKQNKEVADNEKNLAKSLQEVKRLKTEYQEKKEYAEKSKINLDEEREKLNRVIKTIDENGYFKTNISQIKDSKEFINGAFAQLNIKTSLRVIASLRDFETMIASELESVGGKVIVPFDYLQSNGNEAMINIVLLKQQGE